MKNEFVGRRRECGFTLVELMIAVVIIGVLAAIAVPAFKRVVNNTIESAMVNDASLIGRAAQQYWLDNPGVTSIAYSVDSVTGRIDPNSPISDYVKTVSKGITSQGVVALGGAFTMAHIQYNSGAPLSFDEEGKRIGGP